MKIEEEMSEVLDIAWSGELKFIEESEDLRERFTIMMNEEVGRSVFLSYF
jgi:hypothetical protein